MKGSRRYRAEHTTKQIVAHLALVLTCLVFLYPMALMTVNSVKADAEMYVNPAGFPQRWTLQSYGKIFQYHGGMWINYVNSVIIAVTSTVLSVFLCALAAFAFAKYRFKGRNLIFSLLLATMMVPPEITIHRVPARVGNHHGRLRPFDASPLDRLRRVPGQVHVERRDRGRQGIIIGGMVRQILEKQRVHDPDVGVCKEAFIEDRTPKG